MAKDRLPWHQARDDDELLHRLKGAKGAAWLLWHALEERQDAVPDECAAAGLLASLLDDLAHQLEHRLFPKASLKVGA